MFRYRDRNIQIAILRRAWDLEQVVARCFYWKTCLAAGLRFGVFRNGLRIGEITTTKMIDEAFQVADINKGDIRMGDDVRLD